MAEVLRPEIRASWAGRFVLNNMPPTLVGIMPARFTKLNADLYRPVVLDRGQSPGERAFLHVAGEAQAWRHDRAGGSGAERGRGARCPKVYPQTTRTVSW